MHTRSFPLRVDGEILYEMFDTPGFQRARRVLAWLERQDVTPDQRPDAVRAFVRTHRNDPRFRDEVELLTPIMDGAGILYVVDASKPYGEEYEAEMEILRWTGQPSMALVNRIGAEDYSSPWHRALGQYFRLIRDYNPMERDFESHISLLEGVAQLRQEWVVPFKRSIRLFEAYRERLLRQTAQSITRLIQHAITHKEKLRYQGKEPSEADRARLHARYEAHLRALEDREQHEVEVLWHHTHIDKDQAEIALEGMDLFSKKSASIFGLRRDELFASGVTGGAVAGAGVDAMVGGASFLVGTLVGGVVGGASAFFGFDTLSKIRILGQKLGRRHLEIGPMTHRNFPYILLGRALYHAHIVSSRSHAARGTVELSMDASFRDRWLDAASRKALEKYHAKFRSKKGVSDTVIAEYEALIYQRLEKIL